MNSLESICKKKLQIPENISVIEIADFLNKNRIYNPESLFLINFKNIRVRKFKNLPDGTYEILGFKRICEDTFHVYCKKSDLFGEKFLGYSKCIADEKIKKILECCIYKKLDLGFRKIIDKDQPEYYTFKITEELEKKRLKVLKILNNSRFIKNDYY